MVLYKVVKINMEIFENMVDDIYLINLDFSICVVDIEIKFGILSVYMEVINKRKKIRKVEINGVVFYDVGIFLFRGNFNIIREVKQIFFVFLELIMVK